MITRSILERLIIWKEEQIENKEYECIWKEMNWNDKSEMKATAYCMETIANEDNGRERKKWVQKWNGYGSKWKET